MDDDQGRHILDEQLLAQLQAIQESLRSLPKIDERLGRVEDDVRDIKGDLVVVKAIVSEHSNVLREHTADLLEIKQIVGGHMETLSELTIASHRH